MRSNIGSRIASENVRLEDGLVGSPKPLTDRDLIAIAPNLTGNEFEWPKMIWRGQEYNARAHSRNGCYAIVHATDATGQRTQQVVQIQHIVRTPRTLDVNLGQSQEAADSPGPVLLLCNRFEAPCGIRDVWSELQLGFLVQSKAQKELCVVLQSQVRCAPVLSPTTIDGMELLVALPHDKVRARMRHTLVHKKF